MIFQGIKDAKPKKYQTQNQNWQIQSAKCFPAIFFKFAVIGVFINDIYF